MFAGCLTCRQLGTKCATCREKAGERSVVVTAFNGRFRQHTFDVPEDESHDVSVYLRGQSDAVMQELRQAVSSFRYDFIM